MNRSIEGKYEIVIWKEHGRYIAECRAVNHYFITQGMDEQDLFEMIADAFMVSFDIEVKRPWYKRIFNR